MDFSDFRMQMRMGFATTSPHAAAKLSGVDREPEMPITYTATVPLLPTLVRGRKVRWRTWWGELHRTRAGALRAKEPWPGG
jgi:hypothetical protein